MTEAHTSLGDVQVAQAVGEAAQNEIGGQPLFPVAQPPDGGEIILPSLADRIYDLRFDPSLAQVRILDAHGTPDPDLVLLFNVGTPQQSRIVFVDMLAAIDDGEAPVVMQAGDTLFTADLMVQQALALAGEQPTIEATAPAGPEAEGSGANQYNDNLGSSIDLLAAQGVIPGVQAGFPAPGTGTDTPAEDDLLDLTVEPQGVLIVGSNADDEAGQQEPHRVADPSGAPEGPIQGGAGPDILVGDPGGAIVGDLNVAILIDISGSMIARGNNPAPGVTRLDVVQDALAQILPQLAGRDATVNLFIETFARDGNAPLFQGELTDANLNDILADIFALDSQAGGTTNFEAPLVDMRDWYLDQIATTDDFSNVAFFLSDGDPNRYLNDAGNVRGSGFGFQQRALDEALAAVPDLLDPSSGVFSGDDRVELNAIGMDNARQSTLDLLDTTGGAQLVDLGDPSALPDAFLISGVDVGADRITGGGGADLIFGDVPNTDALAQAQGIDLPAASGFRVFEALEAGESAVTPDWDRADTTAYLLDPANRAALIGAGRGESDSIDAGAGDDILLGQGGDDSLTGGTGADRFVYSLSGDEGDDAILDFSTAEGDRLSFLNVVDGDASGTIDIDDAVAGFTDGGGPGAVDTLVLTSGTTVLITDVDGGLTDLASLSANSLINDS